MNLYPISVINDFYTDPDAIRAFALKQEYAYRHQLKDVGYVYPGGRTKDLRELDPTLYAQICKKLIAVFHNEEHDVMRWQISTSFQIVEEKYGHGVIHQDDASCIFAAVLYLTPNAPLNAGTSLFRKNKHYNEQQYIQALDDNDVRFAKGEIKMDTGYHSMFDEVVRVNNVYNTLIIFEGSIHHCANHFFGDSPKNARMAQVFFINRIDAKKHSVFPLKRVAATSV